jgi:hypothetical protein
MIRELILLILIVISLQILIRLISSEGFANAPRIDKRKEWEQLTDDQVVELSAILYSGFYGIYIVDLNKDPDTSEIAKEIGAISFPILNGQNKQVFKNRADIEAIKNKIKNKASGNKSISVALDVLMSNTQAGLKLYKRFYAAEVKKDQAAKEAIMEDVKILAKKGISEIRRKMPKFAFNPDLIKSSPELFVETPKPSSTECKKYFKCSSIHSI